MNFTKFLRTPILQNIWEWLLLEGHSQFMFAIHINGYGLPTFTDWIILDDNTSFLNKYVEKDFSKFKALGPQYEIRNFSPETFFLILQQPVLKLKVAPGATKYCTEQLKKRNLHIPEKAAGGHHQVDGGQLDLKSI